MVQVLTGLIKLPARSCLTRLGLKLCHVRHGSLIRLVLAHCRLLDGTDTLLRAHLGLSLLLFNGLDTIRQTFLLGNQRVNVRLIPITQHLHCVDLGVPNLVLGVLDRVLALNVQVLHPALVLGAGGLLLAQCLLYFGNLLVKGGQLGGQCSPLGLCRLVHVGLLLLVALLNRGRLLSLSVDQGLNLASLCIGRRCSRGVNQSKLLLVPAINVRDLLIGASLDLIRQTGVARCHLRVRLLSLRRSDIDCIVQLADLLVHLLDSHLHLVAGLGSSNESGVETPSSLLTLLEGHGNLTSRQGTVLTHLDDGCLQTIPVGRRVQRRELLLVNLIELQGHLPLGLSEEASRFRPPGLGICQQAREGGQLLHVLGDGEVLGKGLCKLLCRGKAVLGDCLQGTDDGVGVLADARRQLT